MNQAACLFGAFALLGNIVVAWPQQAAPKTEKRSAEGVYVVRRSALNEAEVLPLKDGETLLVHRHRYLKTSDKEPPRFLVVPSAPAVSPRLDGGAKG
jgi:hypothetical protein